MSRTVALLLVLVLFASCHQREPKMPDYAVNEMRAELTGITEDCLEKFKWGGVEAMPSGSDKCFKFDGPKVWKGIWINQFEGSQFCSEPVRRSCPPNPKTYDDQVWLEFSGKPPVELGAGGVYQVEFIGRRSRGKGTFGHFGMSPNDIIIDRMISMKVIEAPPPPPTKAEIAARMKECLAEKSCIPTSVLMQKDKNEAE